MMQTVLEKVFAYAGAQFAAPPPTVQRIQRAQPNESATLVVKHGGRMPLRLVFTEEVTVGAVRAYCIGQCAWEDIQDLPVSVDGKHFTGPAANAMLLTPTTKKVAFGAAAPAPFNLEFRREAGAKG